MTRRHGRFGRRPEKIAYRSRIASPLVEVSKAVNLNRAPPRPVTDLHQSYTPQPNIYDMIVVWDYLRRTKPWLAKPTKVQIRGRDLDRIYGNRIRLLFTYHPKYLGIREANIELPVVSRSDGSIHLQTDREGFETALLSSKEFYGVIDQAGRRFMKGKPNEIRKVAPSNY